eukprot:2032227-Lingulodinium_polyedra.AAC.1
MGCSPLSWGRPRLFWRRPQPTRNAAGANGGTSGCRTFWRAALAGCTGGAKPAPPGSGLFFPDPA